MPLDRSESEALRAPSREELVQDLQRRDAERMCLLAELAELRAFKEAAQAQQRALRESLCLLEATRDRYVDLYERARASNAAKDRFFAMLSHELRAPLAPILTVVEMLSLAEERLDTDMRRSLSLIRRNVRMEARLLDDLLDVARIESGKLSLHREPVDLHAAIAELIEDLHEPTRSRSLHLESRLLAGRSWVEGDPYRLKQALRNLIANAIQLSAPGGGIVIETCNPERDRVRIEVIDGGPGLTSEELERIFEPFQQCDVERCSQKGLGLGLPIAKGVVEAHGGTLRGYSDGRGAGARFVIELGTLSELGVRTTPPVPGPVHPDAARVLLVDDHVDTTESLRWLLERHGYEVRVACGVAEALGRFREGCDVLVSDLQLADGSGRDLLRQLPAGLPAVAISGFGSPEVVQQSRAAGFADHLVKPVEVGRLLAAIERARRAAASAAGRGSSGIA